jgi:hypothetical protein
MSHLPATPLGAKFFAGWAAVPILIAGTVAGFANGLGYFGPLPRANEAAPIMGGVALFTIAGALAVLLSGHWINRRVEMRRMSKTCYAVTDRRAILWVPDTKTEAVRVLSVFRGEIESVVRAELPDGSGNLEISVSHYVGYSPWHPFGFRHVPDVRRVEQIVRNNLVTKEGSVRGRESDVF